MATVLLSHGMVIVLREDVVVEHTGHRVDPPSRKQAVEPHLKIRLTPSSINGNVIRTILDGNACRERWR